MRTIAITYQDRTAALAAPDRYWLAAHIDALPDGHPTKRVVAFMALFARDVLNGSLPGSYTDHRAAAFARLALVDRHTYNAHARCNDRQLAAALRLPVTEISAVRREQAARSRPASGPRRTRTPRQRQRRPRR
jgi:hypothetical protein